MAQLNIDGITYDVIREREFAPDLFPGRVAIALRRPRGKRTYEVVRYANGTYSSVV